MSGDWGEAIVIDPRVLGSLRGDVARLERMVRRRAWLACAIAAATAVALGHDAWQTRRLAQRGHEVAARSREVETRIRELAELRAVVEPSQAALAALARSQEQILDATEHAPSVGTKSWGRRFTVTKYIPRSADYGKDNDGYTATMTKADPEARIVAGDRKLIPYGSWVWVEGLGWYRAEDCGGAIKGFRLDLLTATTSDAMAFGRQERFVIVVPPGGEMKATS